MVIRIPLQDKLPRCIGVTRQTCRKLRLLRLRLAGVSIRRLRDVFPGVIGIPGENEDCYRQNGEGGCCDYEAETGGSVRE